MMNIHIVKTKVSRYTDETLETIINLVQHYAAMYYNHSSMRKVCLFKGHVAYVYWIDTLYVQNNLSTEFSKRTIFTI